MNGEKLLYLVAGLAVVIVTVLLFELGVLRYKLAAALRAVERLNVHLGHVHDRHAADNARWQQREEAARAFEVARIEAVSDMCIKAGVATDDNVTNMALNLAAELIRLRRLVPRA